MSSLCTYVLDARQHLAEGLERQRARHDAGAGGVELCAAMTALRDEVVLALYAAALDELAPGVDNPLREEVALVALGGYGRGETAPYSDVDLMILREEPLADGAAPLARRLTHDLFDAGLVLGHSVRSPQEACRMATRDATICTSLLPSRLLAGSQVVFDRFVDALDRQIVRRRSLLIKAIQEGRDEERQRFGETVYLLEPNVKRSRGGLRDLQLLHWIARIRYGVANSASVTTIDALLHRGELAPAEAEAMVRATDFLLRLRNELHFHAGRAHDVLDRGEQLRIAQCFGYRATEGMLPVETFMRDYFRHTDAVSHIVARFVEHAAAEHGFGWAVDSVMSHRVGNDYRVGPTQIRATRLGLEQLRRGLVPVLQLAELSSLYDKRIAPETWEVIRRSASSFRGPITPEARSRFLSLLKHPARLGELLRALHEVGLLELFVPALRHARGLLQFNQYHKYTVDEHCLRAVEYAAALVSDKGPLGHAYQLVQQKALLHLALLIHDLGKGYADDHCEVGLQIADETAAMLGLSPGAADTLQFLVHKHLLMNHLALRRDIDDESVVVRFAVEVGSPERLRMLYILTACDLAAVGPDTWNSWKADIVTALYHQALRHLTGETPTADIPGTPSQSAEDFDLLEGLSPGEVLARGRYLADTDTVRFTVATSEDVAPGIFHRLTGALAAAGLEILSARINTLADGLVLDHFSARDPDFAGCPPPERLAEIEKSLRDALLNPTAAPQLPRRTWRSTRDAARPIAATLTRVEADNTTSRDRTILDIFAPDRPGLLHAISRTLFELGLSVWQARIGAHLDQVVDVFYVTTHASEKIEDEARLAQIRAALLAAIESHT
jgi:[protein-PII] uridylyltransferase